jgi:hypothetical protein
MDGLASVLSLYAEGPQNKFFVDDKKKPVNDYVPYSNYSIDQTTYKLPKNGNTYLDSDIVFKLSPKEIPGDLLCNAYLKCTLPNIFSNSYSDQIGRALLKSVTLSVNDIELETIDSDWFIIRDQLFLDDNEKITLSNVINNGAQNLLNEYRGGTVDLIIPLEFFFCRRYSPGKSVYKPYFPVCSITRQNLYFKFSFQKLSLISSASDFTDIVGTPEFILEHIKLTDIERVYFKTKQNIIINKIYKDVPKKIDNVVSSINLTASFPVSIITWFIRRKINLSNQLFFTRYFDYTYITSDNITLSDVDIFEYLKLYINNEEITDNQPGLKYYKYLQPLLCNLSTPVKDIYMYSFSTSPSEYNKGGYVDFSKVDSNTSILTFKIKPSLIRDLSQNYELNMYYYGYNELILENGTCRVKYV